MNADAHTGHWFEPIAAHLGAAYLRYSFTKGTEQEVGFLTDNLGLAPGDRVLDVGCGPGRHLSALRNRDIEAFGVDISAPFVRLAGPYAVRGDARRLPVRSGGFDAVISLCQGGFGLPDTDHPPGDRLPHRDRVPHGDWALDQDRQVLAEMARAVKPGGRLALSAFSAYFQVRNLDDATDNFDAATGVNHEHTEIRSESGEVAPTELWTACYTPRELRLLCAAVGVDVEALWSVTPGDYARRAPTIDRHEFLVLARRPT